MVGEQTARAGGDDLRQQKQNYLYLDCVRMIPWPDEWKAQWLASCSSKPSKSIQWRLRAGSIANSCLHRYCEKTYTRILTY